MKTDFREAYLAYSDKIFRFLYWHLKDIYLAEDLTSEVFLRAFKNWKGFKERYLQAWLYRIARNLLIDHYRAKKPIRLDGLEKVPVDAQLEENLAKAEEAERIHQALKKLPENLREVVILRFFEDLSAAEVAEIVGTSEGNIRVLQYRALRKLKEDLDNER